MSRKSKPRLRALAAAFLLLTHLPALAGQHGAADLMPRYWEVKRGDTLYAIGRALAPGNPLRQGQLRAELMRLNPTAFEHGDPGRLIVGRRLEIPTTGVRRVSSAKSSRTAAVSSRRLEGIDEPASAVVASRTNPRRTALRSASTAETPSPPQTELAGRVVASRGQAIALAADGRRRALERRSSVYDGDALVTGPESYLQLRLRDGALVSLRPDSRFKIEAYHYSGKGDDEAKAFFRLVKGGLRTISGLIGKYNKKAYRVATPVATIGIRGTHYGLHLCGADGCAKATPDGRSADFPPGLYGGVVDGAVAVTNDAGEQIFAIDEFFHVSGSETLPKLLPEPPAIVFPSEPLRLTGGKGRRAQPLPSSGLRVAEPESRSPRKSLAPVAGASVRESVATNEPVFKVGEAVEGEVLTDPEVLADELKPRQPLSEPGALDEPLPSDPVALNEPLPADPVALDEPVPSDPVVLDDPFPANPVDDPIGTADPPPPEPMPQPAPQDAVVMARFIEDVSGYYHPHGGTVGSDGSPSNEILLNEVQGADNAVVGYSGDNPAFFEGRCVTCSFSADSASLKNVGGIGGADTGINWGRWTGDYMVKESGDPLGTTGDLFFIYSPNISSESAIAAQSGTAMFTYAGGPAPRDEMGRAGEVLSAYVGVDFDTQQVTSYDLSLKTPDGVGGWRYWNAGLASGPVEFPQALNSDSLSLSGTCEGCLESGVAGNASLRFVGPEVSHGMSGYGLKDYSEKNAATGVMALER